jgi:geranylgeranyl reductase family protein
VNRYDAIVAGAGPAGSMTARQLACRGARVLLLDKQKFPRDKPCGGGVTLRAASVQDIALAPVVEQTIYGARFSLRLGPAFDRRFERPLTYMTQRCRLDAHLAGRAVESGADLHDGEALREIDLEPGLIVRTDRDTYCARVLIGADGANGVTGRSLGLRPAFEEAVALEGNMRFVNGVPEEWRDVVALDLGGLAGGYGWVFPKLDHLNVGVGAWKYAGFTLRSKLAQLAERYGFEASTLENLRGHHLPVRVPGTPLARGPVALAGDAAGLVDPLSGEGIHMAFASGKLAAEQALRLLSGETADMAAYEALVETLLQPELTISRRLQELFNFAPPPYLELMRRSGKFWHFFCALIRGELTYLDFMRMIGPLRLAVNFFAGVAEKRRLSRVESGLRLLADARR